MKIRIICAILSGAFIIPGAASAAGGGMKEGLWEITTSMDMPGMPFQPAPTKVTRCYTKEDLKDDSKVIPKQEGDCKITDATRSFRPKVLYPYHYGETDTARIVALLKESRDIEVRIRRMK